ncbi:esterase/lipase family protein [Sulfurimonas sp.]|uniref:esterase/lipase family protein n=1 Tax=Sulfurimonas sp. TaxID=2022749 RepID=UPI003D13C2B2
MINIGKALQYSIRTNRFKYINNQTNKDTVVVFIHGIFSSTESAFKIKKNYYFWSELSKKSKIFSDFQLATFDYGYSNPSKLLYTQSPINSLKLLSEELYNYIEHYKNIILIGHSQGGLLAKDFTVRFSYLKSIYLVTLHTPHINNTRMFVMKLENGIQKQWKNTTSLEVLECPQ